MTNDEQVDRCPHSIRRSMCLVCSPPAMTNPSAQTMLELAELRKELAETITLFSHHKAMLLKLVDEKIASLRTASAPAAVREALEEGRKVLAAYEDAMACQSDHPSDAKLIVMANYGDLSASVLKDLIAALLTPEEASTAAGETVAWQPLPYLHPADLVKAFNNGSKFVLHYHGKKFDVMHMQAREHVVYVQPPGLPVKVRADGSSAEGTSKGIWLAAAPPAAQTDGVALQPSERDHPAQR